MIIALLVFVVALLLVLGILGLMRTQSSYKRHGFYGMRKNRGKSPTEKLHEILFPRGRDTDRLEM